MPIQFNDELDVNEITRHSRSVLDDLFWEDDEIAEFRHHAFLIECGLVKEDEDRSIDDEILSLEGFELSKAGKGGRGCDDDIIDKDTLNTDTDTDMDMKMLHSSLPVIEVDFELLQSKQEKLHAVQQRGVKLGVDKDTGTDIDIDMDVSPMSSPLSSPESRAKPAVRLTKPSPSPASSPRIRKSCTTAAGQGEGNPPPPKSLETANKTKTKTVTGKPRPAVTSARPRHSPQSTTTRRIKSFQDLVDRQRQATLKAKAKAKPGRSTINRAASTTRVVPATGTGTNTRNGPPPHRAHRKLKQIVATSEPTVEGCHQQEGREQGQQRETATQSLQEEKKCTRGVSGDDGLDDQNDKRDNANETQAPSEQEPVPRPPPIYPLLTTGAFCRPSDPDEASASTTSTSTSRSAVAATAASQQKHCDADCSSRGGSIAGMDMDADADAVSSQIDAGSSRQDISMQERLQQWKQKDLNSSQRSLDALTTASAQREYCDLYASQRSLKDASTATATEIQSASQHSLNSSTSNRSRRMSQMHKTTKTSSGTYKKIVYIPEKEHSKRYSASHAEAVAMNTSECTSRSPQATPKSSEKTKGLTPIEMGSLASPIPNAVSLYTPISKDKKKISSSLETDISPMAESPSITRKKVNPKRSSSTNSIPKEPTNTASTFTNTPTAIPSLSKTKLDHTVARLLRRNSTLQGVNTSAKTSTTSPTATPRVTRKKALSPPRSSDKKPSSMTLKLQKKKKKKTKDETDDEKVNLPNRGGGGGGGRRADLVHYRSLSTSLLVQSSDVETKPDLSRRSFQRSQSVKMKKNSKSSLNLQSSSAVVTTGA